MSISSSLSLGVEIKVGINLINGFSTRISMNSMRISISLSVSISICEGTSIMFA